MILREIYHKMRFEAEKYKPCRLSPEEAEQKLCAFHFHGAPEFIQANSMECSYDLTIIIPVYNVEHYLKECLDSVFSQKTQYRFSVVAVDDGSTDSSGEILEQYAFHDNLTIIHQENRGLSGARNAALKQIGAKYLLFLDSDDYLPENTVENLLNAAFEYNADIVQGNYREFKGDLTVRDVISSEQTRKIVPEEISGFACMKLIRAELLHNFCFPEGFWYEDTVMSKLLYPLCKTAVSIPELVYCYRLHEKSISGADQSAKNIDTYWITKYCLEEAVRRGYPMDESYYRQYLQQSWVNFLRTRYLPEDIQKSIFVLTRELLNKHFQNQAAPKQRKFRMLHRAFQAGSFEAYRFLLARWELF